LGKLRCRGTSGQGDKHREVGRVSLAWETAWLLCEGRNRQRSQKSLRSQRTR
jgi:hypothetical protein